MNVRRFGVGVDDVKAGRRWRQVYRGRFATGDDPLELTNQLGRRRQTQQCLVESNARPQFSSLTAPQDSVDSVDLRESQAERLIVQRGAASRGTPGLFGRGEEAIPAQETPLW